MQARPAQQSRKQVLSVVVEVRRRQGRGDWLISFFIIK
jgi:hypothetical protein